MPLSASRKAFSLSTGTTRQRSPVRWQSFPVWEFWAIISATCGEMHSIKRAVPFADAGGPTLSHGRKKAFNGLGQRLGIAGGQEGAELRDFAVTNRKPNNRSGSFPRTETQTDKEFNHLQRVAKAVLGRRPQLKLILIGNSGLDKRAVELFGIEFFEGLLTEYGEFESPLWGILGEYGTLF